MEPYRSTYEAGPGMVGFAGVFVLLGLILLYLSRIRRPIAAMQSAQPEPLVSRREVEIAAARGDRLLVVPCSNDIYGALMHWQEIAGIKLSRENDGTHRLWITDDLKLAKWTELRGQLEEDTWPSFPGTSEP